MNASRIPIQNVYHLLCYAWNRLEQGGLVDVSSQPMTELVDLFALVLSNGVQHLARRGLEQGYEVLDDDLVGIRGRVDVMTSSRRFLLLHGRAHCRFDELSVNTVANRIVKRTLRDLAACPELDALLRKRIRTILRDLSAITDIEITPRRFREVQLNSNNRFYRFLLNVCEFIHESWLVDPRSGARRFRDFVRDEARMARVFQDFLFNFMNRHISDADVRREHIGWKAASETDPKLALLPRMETDISLHKAGRCVIIDAKYYQSTLSSHHDVSKLHGEHLYQLLSYVSNAEPRIGEAVSGMLIYPRVDRTLRETYTIQGFPISIRTLDLYQPWREVENELRDIVSLQ